MNKIYLCRSYTSEGDSCKFTSIISAPAAEKAFHEHLSRLHACEVAPYQDSDSDDNLTLNDWKAMRPWKNRQSFQVEAIEFFDSDNDDNWSHLIVEI